MQINKELCVDCGLCMNRCPVSAIRRVEKKCKEDPATAEIIKDIRTNINDRYG